MDFKHLEDRIEKNSIVTGAISNISDLDLDVRNEIGLQPNINISLNPYTPNGEVKSLYNKILNLSQESEIKEVKKESKKIKKLLGSIDYVFNSNFEDKYKAFIKKENEEFVSKITIKKAEELYGTVRDFSAQMKEIFNQYNANLEKLGNHKSYLEGVQEKIPEFLEITTKNLEEQIEEYEYIKKNIVGIRIDEKEILYDQKIRFAESSDEKLSYLKEEITKGYEVVEFLDDFLNNYLAEDLEKTNRAIKSTKSNLPEFRKLSLEINRYLLNFEGRTRPTLENAKIVELVNNVGMLASKLDNYDDEAISYLERNSERLQLNQETSRQLRGRS